MSPTHTTHTLPGVHTSPHCYLLLTLGVVSLGPVVAGPGLPEHEVVWAEDLTEGAGPHAVHGAGLQVHQHGLHSIEGERRPR